MIKTREYYIEVAQKKHKKNILRARFMLALLTEKDNKRSCWFSSRTTIKKIILRARLMLALLTKDNKKGSFISRNPKKIPEIEVAGDRTRVDRETGGNTQHDTTTTLLDMTLIN